MRKFILLSALIVALACAPMIGCSTVKGWFGSDSDSLDAPKLLVASGLCRLGMRNVKTGDVTLVGETLDCATAAKLADSLNDAAGQDLVVVKYVVQAEGKPSILEVK